MRKSLLFTLLLTTAASVYAREISPQQALAAAGDFLNSGSRAKVAPSLQKPDDSSGHNPYYVFNTDGRHGFVIISGDDRAPKVLGYSETGSIDPANLPPQLKAILDNLGERVRTLPEAPHPSWSMELSASSDEGVLIPTANWGQTYPYNAECPVVDGEPTLTGCVATAMAIVMKHHNWPENYDWSAMPMNNEEDPLDYGKDSPELARLMHDAGEAVFMKYDPVESGAYLDWIGHRMQYVFHYSPECQYLGWENYGLDTWESMLKSNLDKGNPVIYDGYGTGGHHAFVIDGYTGDNYHVNWGWHGMANGYFPIMDLTPFEYENFSEHQGMVINIEPDPEMREYSECFVDYGYLWAVGANRMAAEMNVSVSDIETGKPFNLINSAITVTAGFEGLVGVAIVDKDENIKEVLRTHYISSYQSWDNTYSTTNTSISYYNLIPSCKIDSTDRLQLVSKHDKDADFKLMLGTMEWASSIPVTGNTPLTATVTFDIGEGIECRYFAENSDSEWIDLAPGKTLVDALIGERYSISFTKNDPDGADPMHLALHGKMYSGDDEYWTGHEPKSIGFGIFAPENSVEINLIHLTEDAVHLDTAGTLSEKIDSASAFTLGNLTITGKMNAKDFWFLRDNCANLTTLDLAEVTIEEFTGGDGEWVWDDMLHPANAIPYRALVGLANLSDLTLPRNLESIEGFSMQGMNLTSLSVPAGVKKIGRDVFYCNFNLEAIELLSPEVVEIGYPAFDFTKCPENGVLFVPEGLADDYASAEIWKDFGKIVEREMPNPLKFTTTIDNIIYDCYVDEAKITGWEGAPVNVVIPETISANGDSYTVTSISDFAFEQCSTLESIKMPDTIKKIGIYAFQSCRNLKEIALSDNLEEIEMGTFCDCTSLEEFTIGPNIKYIDGGALLYTGLKSLFIPKTLLVRSPGSVFNGLPELDEFVVEEGNEYFSAIDGNLYRISERGLSLEAVAGKKSGTLILPDVCREVMAGALAASRIERLILNDGLESLVSNSIRDTQHLKHISIPKSVRMLEDAIAYCWELESIEFRGKPQSFSHIINGCPKLQHVYINAPEENVSLDGLFADDYENLNIFSPTLDKGFEYGGSHTLFIPGGCSDNYASSSTAELKEMWKYVINRRNNYIAVIPSDDVTINTVTINGRTATPLKENSNCYPIEEIMTVSENIDAEPEVTVEFTLHGHQTLTTHYTKEFNATIEDSDHDIITGINKIDDSSFECVNVYSLDGSLILVNADKAALSRLEPGLYILDSGSKITKVMINH